MFKSPYFLHLKKICNCTKCTSFWSHYEGTVRLFWSRIFYVFGLVTSQGVPQGGGLGTFLIYRLDAFYYYIPIHIAYR